MTSSKPVTRTRTMKSPPHIFKQAHKDLQERFEENPFRENLFNLNTYAHLSKTTHNKKLINLEVEVVNTKFAININQQITETNYVTRWSTNIDDNGYVKIVYTTDTPYGVKTIRLPSLNTLYRNINIAGVGKDNISTMYRGLKITQPETMICESHLAKEFGLELWEIQSEFLHFYDHFVTCETIVDLALKLFNSKRRDLIKTMAISKPRYIAQAWEMYDETMPIDVAIRFMNTLNEIALYESFSVFQKFSSQSRRKMMANYSHVRDTIPLLDTLRMENMEGIVPTKEVKHFKEAEEHLNALLATRRRTHQREALLKSAAVESERAQWLTTEAGIAWQERQDERERLRLEKLAAEEAARLEKLKKDHAKRVEIWDDLVQTFDGVMHTDQYGTEYIIKAARDTQILDRWSEHLGTNCIGNGGYDRLLEEREDVLLGIYKNNTEDSSILYTAEIQISNDGDLNLRQFRGYNNRMPENDEWFIAMLKHHKIKIANK